MIGTRINELSTETCKTLPDGVRRPDAADIPGQATRDVTCPGPRLFLKSPANGFPASLSLPLP